MIGCIDQSENDNNNLTIAATSVAVTEILEALDVPADQVIGIRRLKVIQYQEI